MVYYFAIDSQVEIGYVEKVFKFSHERNRRRGRRGHTSEDWDVFAKSFKPWDEEVGGGPAVRANRRNRKTKTF